VSRYPGEGIERDSVPVARDPLAQPDDARVRSVFERKGRGVAVLDHTGAIVATDAAFRRLVGLRRRSPGRELTCCALLGCGRPGNAALGGCVSDRLLRSGDAIRDVGLELPGRPGTVWLSGAALDDGCEIAVLELRDTEASRPRRAGHAPEGAVIRVHVLGRMQIETSEGVVSGAWLDQRPGQLLKFLIAERRRVVPVEDIAEALWPSAEFATVNTVRHLVHVLRRRLEPGERRRPGSDAASCIVSCRGGYTLDETRVILDADEFSEVAQRALSAFEAGDDAARAALGHALALYRGDFVGDDPYAAWAQPERERLRTLVERVLQALGEDAQASGDIRGATAYVERLAEFEPFDSAPQRALILLSLQAGRRGRALRQYEAFDARMQRAFGERPDFSLEELMRVARP
jgi:DNA-binding SARP family transcriptional activator